VRHRKAGEMHESVFMSIEYLTKYSKVTSFTVHVKLAGQSKSTTSCKLFHTFTKRSIKKQIELVCLSVSSTAYLYALYELLRIRRTHDYIKLNA